MYEIISALNLRLTFSPGKHNFITLSMNKYEYKTCLIMIYIFAKFLQSTLKLHWCHISDFAVKKIQN
jgi:hypothetical protein